MTMGGVDAANQPAEPESVFTYGAPQLRFGPGASGEIGYDLAETGARRVLLLTDPGVAATARTAITNSSGSTTFSFRGEMLSVPGFSG